jgi:cell division protein FtsL
MDLSPSTILPGKGAPQLGDKRIFSRAVPGGDAAVKRNGERGGGRLKAVIWTMILVAIIYVAAMMLPVLINEYQFQDGLQNIARFASVNRKSGDEIRKSVLDEAEREDLPIQAEDIKVESHNGNIKIDVDYSVTVDLKVYQWTLNFHPAASNASLL